MRDWTLNQYQRCELCSNETEPGGRLCISCSEMIDRLSRIAQELHDPSHPSTRAKNATRLYERALGMNMFNISDYKR